MLFDETQKDDTTVSELEEQYEDVRPLGEEMIDTLVDLLFYLNFTLPTNDQSKTKVTYSIWQSGVGCNTAVASSSQMESNRSEILRLLLTLSSEALYMPARAYDDRLFGQDIANPQADVVAVKGVKAVTYLTTCPDKQVVLSLLCSQLNTVSR